MGQPDQQGGVEFHQSPPVTIDDDDLYEPPPPKVNQFPPPPPPVKNHEVDYNIKPPPQQDDVHQFPPPPNQDTNNVQPFPPPPEPDNNNNNAQPFPPPPQPFPPKPDNINGQPFPPPPKPPQPQPAINGSLQPWKTELFDCMLNPQNALITLLFPCVTFGQIAEVVDAGSTSCTTSGMMYSVIVCFIVPCIMSCTYRTKLRSKFGLAESPASDFLIHCFCEYCALCQEYRELEQRGIDPSIGWLGNVAKQQQQQQFGMTPPQQQRMF